MGKGLKWIIVLAVFIGLLFLANVLLGPDADKLQGVTWIWFTALALVIVYVVYLATSASKAWEVGTREVVYMAIGAALYGVLSWIFNTIPMPSVSNVALRPAIAIPIFFGYVFGPVVGFFTGAVGNILGDFLTGWGVYPAWDIANGLIGFVPGLVLLFADKKKSLNTLTIIFAALTALSAIAILLKPVVPHPWTGEETDFSFWAWGFLIGGAVVIIGRYVLAAANEDLAAVNVWGAVGIIVGIGFAAIADIWINGYSLAVAMIGEFAPAAGPNILNAMIITPILLAAYQAVQARSGR